MSFHVLNVAYPYAAAGPSAAGGAEQILSALDRALEARGRQTSVAARGGSITAGELFATHVPAGVITPAVREEVTRAHQRSIDQALRTREIDLIHMHGIDFHHYQLPRNVPVLVTLHMPPSWYPESIWHLPANYRLQCVSESQRRSCPAELREKLTVIENGVSLSAKGEEVGKSDFVLLLSRICPEKNLHAGLDAARLARVPAVLAGETFPYEEHLRYLREVIEPRLGPDARLVGALGGEQKRRMLSAAQCVLLPTLAAETSSLVAMEAMAAGTPVIAYRSGALPEIVEHGRTGFLVDTVVEMAEAIGRTDQIDPEICRSVAASRFSEARMVEAYLSLYRQMVAEGPAA